MKHLWPYLQLLWSTLFRGPGMLLWAQRYLDAWSRQDVDEIVRITGDGGYADTLTEGALKGEALQTHLRDLFRAFPDLRLDLTGPITAGRGAVSAGYRLLGTNDGELTGDMGFDRLQATGRKLELEGVIFIQFLESGTPWIRNHFFQRDLAKALDFQNFLLPRRTGEYDFGAYYRRKGDNFTPPEAIGITWLHLTKGQSEFRHVTNITRDIMEDFAASPGFVTGIVGARDADENGESFGFTLSAWENVEAMNHILESPVHKEAVRQFMKEDLAYGTHSRVYRLERAKPVMIACSHCGKKNNAHKANRQCSACRTELPPAPPHW